ncbi:MAG: hypothetical protein FWC51_01155 [Proteobacteria bacterium]|nr:hypothetical protein [Pseudomonadota bacterium]
MTQIPHPNDIVYTSDNRKIPFREIAADKEVIFEGGLWRLQDKFPHKTIEIKGEKETKEFVLLNQLPNSGEFIQFYNATQVGKGCYGKFLTEKTTAVLAKCGTFWGYGDTADLARGMVLSNAAKTPNLNILKTIRDYVPEK